MATQYPIPTPVQNVPPPRPSTVTFQRPPAPSPMQGVDFYNQYQTATPQPIPSPQYSAPTPRASDLSGISVPQLDVTLSPEPEKKLSIYSRSAHIVEFHRRGVDSIVLPSGVNIESLVVLNSEGQVVPFQYIPAADLYQSARRGRTATVYQDNVQIQGTVLNLSSNTATLLTEQGIVHIRDYDRVETESTEDFTRPRLVPQRKDKDVSVSYRLDDLLRWHCTGTAVIEGNKMNLRLAGQIDNGTGREIVADTLLVAGDIAQEEEYGQPRAMRAMMASPEQEEVSSGMLEDFTTYKIGPQAIGAHSTVELGVEAIEVMKLYQHNTRRDIVNVGYRFKTPKFIPRCTIEIYAGKDRSISSFLGQSSVKETPRGETVDIVLGESTRLQCQSEVIRSDYQATKDILQRKNIVVGEREWRAVREDLTTLIANHDDQVAHLIVRHYVGDKLLLDISCQQYQKRKDGYLEWYLAIPAGTTDGPHKNTFKCSIVTLEFM